MPSFSRISRIASSVAWALGLLVLHVATSEAAELAQTNSDICPYALSGTFEPGDGEKVMRILDEAVGKYSDGESTNKLKVCLDSPGGSLSDAVKIAEGFQKIGVGTVIDKDAKCLSACALIFMFGTAQGPEVAFVSRAMNKNAILGFHRPALGGFPSGTSFTDADVEKSFNVALDSVVNYLLLANTKKPWSKDPYIDGDLLQQIFSHEGDDYFYIDTVEKAGRWDIDVLGYPRVVKADASAAYYACENLLHWGDHLQLSDLSFAKEVLKGWWGPITSMVPIGTGGLRFSVTSRDAGYSSVGCFVDYAEGAYRLCGENEANGINYGPQGCFTQGNSSFGKSWTVPGLSLFQPSRRLSSLDGESGPNGLAVRCAVLKGSSVIDDEICQASVGVSATDAGQPRYDMLFTWPSGSRTYIEKTEKAATINGANADHEYIDRFDACYKNLDSGNKFCYRVL